MTTTHTDAESDYDSAHAEHRKRAIRERLSFRRRRDAVADIGLDPEGEEPVDDALQAAFDRGTLVEFPAGEYRVESPVRVRSGCGIVGAPDSRRAVRFVPEAGTEMRWLKFGGARGVLLSGFTLDRRADYATSVGMGGNVEGDVLVEDVEYDGWTPSGPQMLSMNVTDPDGVAVVDGLYRTGPTEFQRYPDSSIDVWSGRGHEGHMVLRNVEIHNGSESGIYTGKGEGSYLVEDCYMKNVVHTAIRAGGRDSTVRGCTVVMDTDDWDPRNERVEETYDEGEPTQLNRGIWAQTNDKRFAGPRIEDCDIVVRRTEQAIAGVLVNADTGGAVLRDVRVRVDDEKVVPVLARRPDDDAGEPRAMSLDGVHVCGTGWRRGAVTVVGRPDSVVRDCCLVGGGDGVVLEDSPGTAVENTRVDVDGRAVVATGCDPAVTGGSDADVIEAAEPGVRPSERTDGAD